MLEKMQSLLSTEQRATYQEMLLEEYVELEKIVGGKLTKKTKHTLQDLYKSMRDKVHSLITRTKVGLEGLDGYTELNEMLEELLMQHRDAIAVDMGHDFELIYSDHDLIRKEMQLIKHILSRPVKQIEKAMKEKENEVIETPIEETPAEDIESLS